MLKYGASCAVLYILIVALDFTVGDITVRVANGSSFRLDLFPKTLDNPINCALTDGRNIDFQYPYDYRDNDTVIGGGRTVQRLGNGHCAIRIFKAHSRNDAGRFNLTISNGVESVFETFRVTFVSSHRNENRTTYAAIATSRLTLVCGPMDNMLYCEFRDPYGNLLQSTVRTRCQIQIDILSARHFGLWSCNVGVIGEPSEIYATHLLLRQDETERIVISSNDTRLGTFLYWRVDGMRGTALWCRAFAPNGETILVLPAMENENFVSVATDMSEKKCGLLINGKFPRKFYGLWRLEIGINNRRAMGGFLRMPEGKIPDLEDSLASRNEFHAERITELNIPARTQFRINCQTNYSASYCWIGGPNGQQYTQSENLTVGRCSQLINGSDHVQHSGIWTCNMAHVDGGPEEQFVTRVNVVENHYRAVESEVEARLGYPAVVECHSVLELPLEYCRFVRPDGKGFGVFPERYFHNGGYRYVGSGLDFGVCGLRIEAVEPVDVGQWKCVTRTRSRMWEAEASDTVNLQPELRTTIEVAGISAVVIVLSTLIAIFIVLSMIMWFKVVCHRDEYVSGREEGELKVQRK